MPSTSRNAKITDGNSDQTNGKRVAAFDLAFRIDGNFDWWWRRLAFARFAEPENHSHDLHPYTTFWVGDNDPLVEKSLHPYYKRWGIKEQFEKWKSWRELVAWSYELGRRFLFEEYLQGRSDIDDSLMPLPSYPNIHVGLEGWLNSTFSQQESSPLVLSNPIKTDSQWSAPIEPYQIDLSANDNTLISAFMEIVADLRLKKGVKVRKKNAGNYNKKVSWRVIEEWDESFNFKTGRGTYCASSFKKKAKILGGKVEYSISCWKEFCRSIRKKCAHDAGPHCWVEAYLVEHYEKQLDAYLETWRKLKPEEQHKIFL